MSKERDLLKEICDIWDAHVPADYMSDIHRRMREVLRTEPVAVPGYLAGGTRYKITFDSRQSDGRIYGLPKELNGQCVALVDATDNRHMLAAAPQPEQPAQCKNAGNPKSCYRVRCQLGNECVEQQPAPRCEEGIDADQ